MRKGVGERPRLSVAAWDKQAENERLNRRGSGLVLLLAFFNVDGTELYTVGTDRRGSWDVAGCARA